MYIALAHYPVQIAAGLAVMGLYVIACFPGTCGKLHSVKAA